MLLCRNSRAFGKKSASQIILDLKGKLKPDETADPAETAAAAADSVYVDEALLALLKFLATRNVS
jgi:Holliday junction resolvasome, DNA-binding subunit